MDPIDRALLPHLQQDATQSYAALGEVVGLRPGGRLIFTYPMAADGCPAGVLQADSRPIHLDDMGSPAFCTRELTRLGGEGCAAAAPYRSA